MTSVAVNGGVHQLNVASSSQWVEIQRNTFKNWVNEQLKGLGLSIFDLRTDFADGVMLVALVERLQRRKLSGAIRHPSHNHEKLHNITIALDAIASDNVTLISIDSSHITEGNTKLILALLWQLVLRYQIGLSNFQQRGWLLAWVQAVIPECHVNNLTTDWNSGVALNALLEFCKKGLCPEWKSLNPLDRVNNCRDGMKLARQHFGIPLVLRPEDLANSNLDELSAITYLSYFTKIGAPGYNATLQKIQPLVRNHPVFNFTTDWKDGRVLCELVHVFGGNIPSWPELNGSNEERIKEGLHGASSIGVQPLLSVEEIAEEGHEHLGIMAYAARFLRVAPGVTTYEHSYKETRIIKMDDDMGHLSRTSTLDSAAAQQLRLTNGRPNGNHRDSSPSSVSSTNISETQHQLEYTLVRTPSIRRKQRQEVKSSEGIKKDTYSDGVIIYATSHTTVTPDDVKLEAESPTGRLIKMNGDGMYHAQFGSDEIGTWTVALAVNGQVVDSCQVNVCDPSQVRVTGLKAGMSGNQHKFNIDCSQAGQGKLEIDVSHEGRSIPCYLSQQGSSLYSATFTPAVPGHYKIAILYNKAEIRGIFDINDFGDDASIAPGDEELHRQAVFSTSMKPHHDHYKISANCDWQIDYLTGGPIDMYIGDTADVRVYSMQDGTVCNVPHLIADVSNAPPGGFLEAEVQYGMQRFPADVIEDKDKPGLYKIVFKPRGPGTYNIFIIYDKRIVKGSPYIQEIAELTSPGVEGPGLKKGIYAEPCVFNIDARGFPGNVTVDVQGPHFPIRCTVTQNPDNTHTVTYVPEEVGIHRINVKLDDKPVQGSPYHPKVVDPSRVMLTGAIRDRQDHIPLQVDREKHIPFDASHAGPGELTANVHGPSDKIPVTIDARGDGQHSVIFTPKEQGKHYIDVFWNGFALPSSPFQGYASPASDEPDAPIELMRRSRTSNRVQSNPVERNPSLKDNSYWVRADRRPNSPVNGPHKIYVLAPGKSEPTQQVQAVNYPPTRIRVYRHGSDISPIHKARHYHSPKRTGSVYSSSTRSVKSEPKKREPDIVITRLPRPETTYTPYTNSTQYNVYPVEPERSRSPEIYAYPSSPKSSSPSVSPSYIYTKPQKSPPSIGNSSRGGNPKVVLRGKGLKEAELDKPATFTIDGREAGPEPDTPRTGIVFQYGADMNASFDEIQEEYFSELDGEPEVRLHSIRSEPPVNVVPTGPKQYQCSYIPRVPGAYLLDIKWNGKPLKCCPFKIDVKKPVYPEKVGVTGDILHKGGVLGKEIDLKIDPRDAGHDNRRIQQSELTIDCKDPDNRDVPVHLTDNYDGTYRLRVKPERLGKHILSIKLNKQHVFGSPYAIEIRGRPQTGTIKVWGPGLDSGVLADYHGHFFVDATGAGGGELHVSVMGLKGAFHVEMKRASQKDKLFNCLYHPLEPGMYTINVQWSGDHVPGSPYRVFVAGTEMELIDYKNQLERSRNSSARSGTGSSGKFSPNTTQNSIMY